MTPGRKRVGMNEKKKNVNFRVNAKSGVTKGSNGSSVKKAKAKTVPKKKSVDFSDTKIINPITSTGSLIQEFHATAPSACPRDEKLKDQTTKWIEDVNKTFNDLQPKLANEKMAEKSTNQKEAHKEEERIQTIKSDVSDAEVSSTIANMANLLEQT